MMTQYMLRRTLCPWNIEALVDETLDYCARSRVDEMVWITESSGCYRELLPIEGIRALMPGLQYAREQTLQAGLIYSLNPLTTIGHGEYGNDIAAIHPEMEMMVDYTGRRARAAACPLSPYWRQLMLETFGLYAQTAPARLWIEDDFRYMNHGTVRFGCYCELHRREFAARTGRYYTREELVAELLSPGRHAPLRRQWFDFLSDTLSEMAGRIARQVHAISPSTTMAWMANNPSSLDISGVDARRILDGCAQGRQSGIRMNTTRYQEKNGRDILLVDENIKKIAPWLPEHTLRCTEVETCPHSLYAKSAAGIAAQIEWSGILGACNHTLNIFDYIGSPMDSIPRYGRMLAERKMEFESLARAFAGTHYLGIGMLYRPLLCDAVQAAEGRDMAELAARECGFADAVRAFGMPIIFGHNAPVTAATGQSLRAFSRGELEKIFSRGVLLDGVALNVLQEIGLDALAGARIDARLPRKSRPLGPEELTDPDFGGHGRYAYTWTGDLWPEYVIVPGAGTRMISRIVDLNGQYLMPGFLLYENRLGGRVAVCPYDLGGNGLDPFINREPGHFFSEYRKRQMRAIIRWLNGGPPPLTVDTDGWVLPHCAAAPDRIMAAAMNVSFDLWDDCTMHVATPGAIKLIRCTDIAGRWHALSADDWTQADGMVTMHLAAPVPPLRTVAAEILLRD